jgi:DNA invertase Pin-like site-specific DNA recombinase
MVFSPAQPPETVMKRAYSYIRFSTPEQSRGDSFRRQSEFSKLYAERHSLVLDESFNLRDLGISAFRGTNVKEGALAGFLEAIKTGRVPKGSTLIIESLDRLSRDQIRPALQLFMNILDGGVSIVTIKPEREYLPENQDPLSLIEPLIYFSRAHEESQTKSSRVSDSWDMRRRKAASEGKAMTTVCPSWVHLVDGKYELIPEKAAIVKRIFSMSKEGMGTYIITKTLRNENVPPIGRSKNWNTAYVRLILSDRRAIGELQPMKSKVAIGEKLVGYFPAVVSEEDYYVALGGIKGRKKRAGRNVLDCENLFSGMVFHAEDGNKMHFNSSRGVSIIENTAGYYGSPAKGRFFQYIPFENAVLDLLTEIQPESIESEKNESMTRKKEEIEGKLAEVTAKLTKVNERARKGGDLDMYLDLISSLSFDQKDLKKQLEDMKSVLAIDNEMSGGELRSIISIRKGKEGEQRKMLSRKLKSKIRALVKEIWILIEVVKRGKKIGHIQVYLNDGRRRYCKVQYPAPGPEENVFGKRTNFDKIDLRTYRNVK